MKKSNHVFKRFSEKFTIFFYFRFLATGDTFRTIAFSYRLGETTVRDIVYLVCAAIWNILGPLVLPEPTEQAWKTIGHDFNVQWNFPNCIGAIDGKHVVTDKPPNSGSLFFNYKKSFSIILLAVVDANYKFISIDVGAYGRNSDGGVFANSTFGKKFINNSLNIPQDKTLPGTDIVAPHIFVGDEAFPLHRHLMRPYPGNQTAGVNENKIFNYRLSRARRVSENCFGILVKKFRIYQRKLQILPEHLDQVVLATCCLHNFLRNDNNHFAKMLEADVVEEPNGLQNLNRIGGRRTNVASETRDIFKNYFTSAVGSVDWQDEMIRRGTLHT